MSELPSITANQAVSDWPTQLPNGGPPNYRTRTVRHTRRAKVVSSVGEEPLRTNQPNYRGGYRDCCDPSQQTADHGCDERDDEVGVEVPEGRALRASRKQEALPIMSYRYVVPPWC